MRPLIIIPTYCADEEAIALTVTCVSSCASTAGDQADVLVVDDGSPEQVELQGILAHSCVHEFVAKSSNGGFSKTVNVGLRRAFLEGRDAILVNADVEFAAADYGWSDEFYNIYGEACHPVQGAVLDFPTVPAMVQHAGVYFSVLRREFDHIYRFAPSDLPELDEWRRCPVTGALMFISANTLDEVGLFDEKFRMGWEDVDYCLRVFAAGRECWVNPHVRAVHHEQAFRSAPSAKRSRWDRMSLTRLFDKHAGEDFSQWVPTMLGDQ